MTLKSAFLRNRPGSGAAAMLCILVATLLAVLPTPDFGFGTARGSAFSAATSDQCVGVSERNLDARRALQKARRSGPLETLAPAPEIMVPACVKSASVVQHAALAPRDLPASRPSTTRARAPPFA